MERIPPKQFADFIRGADLWIADGQYSEAEYERYRGWGHSRATTLVDAAKSTGVKSLAITHHDPMQSDADVDEKIDSCRARAARIGYDGIVFAAREKMELRVV